MIRLLLISISITNFEGGRAKSDISVSRSLSSILLGSGYINIDITRASAGALRCRIRPDASARAPARAGRGPLKGQRELLARMTGAIF